MFPLSSDGKNTAIPPFSDDERALLDKVAKKVVEWKMAIPAIMTLESVKPLNFISAQAMIFFEPMVQTLLNLKDYDMFRSMLERRESIEALLLRIEHFDAISYRKEKVFKKLQKEYLKSQSWTYRLKSSVLGFRVPKHLEQEWKAKLDAVEAEIVKSESSEGRS
jgi:ASC-1-like (ASCH) protein